MVALSSIATSGRVTHRDDRDVLITADDTLVILLLLLLLLLVVVRILTIKVAVLFSVAVTVLLQIFIPQPDPQSLIKTLHPFRLVFTPY
jgi:hypothetical protein